MENLNENDSQLINFINKNKIKVDGIIQVGANTGQEIELIKQITKNILCFEPIPEAFNVLQSNNQDILSYNFALGDVEEIKNIFTATNNYESSSFLKPKNHSTYYPSIKFSVRENISIKRFDNLDIDIKNKYNVLISDTQGYEIKVLKGFGEMLKYIDLIYVEYINSELYEGDSSLTHISDYLSSFNFKLEETTTETNGAGNALFKKI